MNRRKRDASALGRPDVPAGPGRAKRLLRLTGAAALAAAAACAAGLLAAQVIANGLNLSITAVNSGGTESTGGGFHNISAIGGHGVAMSGGGFTLSPGPLSSVRPPALDTSQAHAYPTPFMPSQGHTHITFTRLPSVAEIKVFTIAGTLVKTLEKNDQSDSLVWTPVTNEQGGALASGVYPFVVIQPGISRKSGKIMIVK